MALLLYIIRTQCWLLGRLMGRNHISSTVIRKNINYTNLTLFTATCIAVSCLAAHARWLWLDVGYRSRTRGGRCHQAYTNISHRQESTGRMSYIPLLLPANDMYSVDTAPDDQALPTVPSSLTDSSLLSIWLFCNRSSLMQLHSQFSLWSPVAWLTANFVSSQTLSLSLMNSDAKDFLTFVEGYYHLFCGNDDITQEVGGDGTALTERLSRPGRPATPLVDGKHELDHNEVTLIHGNAC